MMQINGVTEYTETCEYEANKIHIRIKKLRIRRTLVPYALDVYSPGLTLDAWSDTGVTGL
jgi:hypothetical protein